MSAPYPQSSPQGASNRGGPALGIKEILALVAAGAGLIGYVIGFFNVDAGNAIGSVSGFALIVAATLAGLRFVPKTPNGLFAAAPLAAYATLSLLQGLVGGGSGGIVVVLLLLALVQLAAVLGVLLIDGGMIAPPTNSAQPSKPAFGQPAPFQPGGPSGPRPGNWIPAGQPGQSGQPGQPQPGQPGQSGQSGQSSQPGPSAQPGQFGQQGGWSPATSGQPQQPGGWNPPSGGSATPNPPGQSNQPGQPGPSSQSGQAGQSGPQAGPSTQTGQGPQGTQQLPHPAANPPSL